MQFTFCTSCFKDQRVSQSQMQKKENLKFVHIFFLEKKLNFFVVGGVKVFLRTGPSGVKKSTFHFHPESVCLQKLFFPQNFFSEVSKTFSDRAQNLVIMQKSLPNTAWGRNSVNGTWQS